MNVFETNKDDVKLNGSQLQQIIEDVQMANALYMCMTTPIQRI